MGPCRVVLAAASGFFRALFTGAWHQHQQECVPGSPLSPTCGGGGGLQRFKLSGVDSASLRLLLHALYSKRLPLTAEGAAEEVPLLLAASNYLEVGTPRACIGLPAPVVSTQRRCGLHAAAATASSSSSSAQLAGYSAHCLPAAIEDAAQALLPLTDCGCACTCLCPWLPACCVLQVLPIKQACCQYLRSELSLQTVACTLALAAAHDCSDLLADAVSAPLCVHVVGAGVPAVVWQMRETWNVVPGVAGHLLDGCARGAGDELWTLPLSSSLISTLIPHASRLILHPSFLFSTACRAASLRGTSPSCSNPRRPPASQPCLPTCWPACSAAMA